MTKKRERIYKIAVATKRGEFVDEHFAYVNKIVVFYGDGKNFMKHEIRNIDENHILDAIIDCDAVVTLPLSHYAKQMLINNDVVAIEYDGLIKNGIAIAVKELIKKYDEKKAV